MKQNPLIPPLQSDVGPSKPGPTIDDLGDRTIDSLSGTISELVPGEMAVTIVNGKPHLVVQATIPSGKVRVGVPLTLELIAFLRAALQE